MSENEFKGIWIPKEIWSDDRLDILEKVILATISGLDMGEDGCWASNEYLAKHCHCSVRKVAYAVAKLKQLGCIHRTAFDGRHRRLRGVHA